AAAPMGRVDVRGRVVRGERRWCRGRRQPGGQEGHPRGTCESIARSHGCPLSSGTRMRQRTRGSRFFVVAAAVCALAGPARAQTCPIAPDPAVLPDAAALEDMNAFVDGLGVRPTGSTSHVRYTNWIRRRLREILGVTVSELPYPIDRWSTT